MTVLAVTTGEAVLGLIGLALGVVVLLLVVNMLQAVLRPIQEIDRYANDILAGGIGIATHLDGADHLVRTHELGGALPGVAVAFLEAKGAGR